jgi:Mg-chelatase subunit ChlD
MNVKKQGYWKQIFQESRWDFLNFPLGKMFSVLMAMLVVLSALPLASADQQIVQTAESCVVEQNDQVNCIPMPKPMIDVVFVIDSTGSMGDEIRTVKTHLIQIIKEVKSGQPSPDLRVGVVAYRDHELEESGYLYKKLDLTSDIDRAVEFIYDIEAAGGGDLPEAVVDGLDVAINRMNWRDYVYTQNQNQNRYPDVKKIVFLIGDAAPHGEGSSDSHYEQGCPHGHNYKQNIEDAQKMDITIYTVMGSGIDSVGTRIFKTIADKTGGEYTNLRYVRKEVQQYYSDEGFTKEEIEVYAAEAKEDRDYDSATNSILTNTLGVFAKTNMKAEAMEMGVEYDNKPVEDDSWIDIEDITGDVVIEEDEEVIDSETSLSGFFKKIFGMVVFWR